MKFSGYELYYDLITKLYYLTSYQSLKNAIISNLIFSSHVFELLFLIDATCLDSEIQYTISITNIVQYCYLNKYRSRS